MNFLHYFGLLSLAVVGKVVSKPSCSSEKNFSKNKEETSCINLGLSSLQKIEIPKNTAILILSSNNFKSLSTSSFQGFKDLTELELADNGMTSFEIDVPLMLEELNLANNTLKTLPMVSKLSRLITLQLSNNHISTIPENAFMGLKKLTRLELQHNNIDSLEEEVFQDLQSLKHLDLSYNQLWHLPNGLLSSVENLEILYLSGNRLTEIPDNFFEGLELGYVYLEKNHWNCNCALRYFKNWLEENEDSVYEISKEGPTKNPRSVVCSGGTPLIDFDMDICMIKGKGDMDNPPITKDIKKAVQTEPLTTLLWTTTPMETTKFLKTEKPTTQLRTTKWWPISTPTKVESSPIPTTVATTVLPTTTPTRQATTILPTTTQGTTMLEPTTATESLKTSQRTTVRSTTTPYPTTLMTTTEEPSTTLLVVVTTDIPSEVPTSEGRVKTSTMSPTDETTEIQVNTMLPARSSRASAFGWDWLVKVILEHCCLLHVIIYGLCIFLLLVGMIITTMCLVWIYCCNRDLLQWLPGIRLIRYSIRVPMSDEEILLVNNGAIESHFRDESMVGVTKMLVLESDHRQQEIRYTSAIL